METSSSSSSSSEEEEENTEKKTTEESPMEDEEENVSQKTWRWRVANILLMALGFLLVFMSFYTTQNFTTRAGILV